MLADILQNKGERKEGDTMGEKKNQARVSTMYGKKTLIKTFV